MPNALYQSGVTCGQVSCDTLAGHGDCLMEFSISFRKCVNTTTGLVKEFCKKSCNNCGKESKDQDILKSNFIIQSHIWDNIVFLFLEASFNIHHPLPLFLKTSKKEVF